jgi:nucleoside-diphosphate-sugar epimerase
MKFTILGSTGFIGRRMVTYLREQGHEVATPERDVSNLQGMDLGHVIYAIGLTGNFRTQPQAAIEAHVIALQRLMKDADYQSWLYLSSTRVYGGLPQETLAKEDVALPVQPGADSLYDLSKLLGESICLSINNPVVRVARLSNVYGTGQSKHTFLGSIIHELLQKGNVTLQESPLSAKDYISVDYVVPLLTQITVKGQERLYNVASGISITHQELADKIQQCEYNVYFKSSGTIRSFPRIDVSKINQEFGGKTSSILDDLPLLLKAEAHAYNKEKGLES